MLRAIQSPWTDSVLLRLASWVHRGQFDKTLLQQRILYMYESPRRMDSRNLRQEYVHHGISVIAEHAQPHVSVAQMKQHFACFIKQAA